MLPLHVLVSACALALGAAGPDPTLERGPEHGDTIGAPLLFVGGAPDAFGTIQEALDAAAAGDRIVVRAGDYDELVRVATGSSVSLVAEAGGLVRVRGVVVERLPQDQTVVVRGIRAELGSVYPPGIAVAHCLGNVWIEDCTAEARRSLIGVQVTDSDSVVLVRCRVAGGTALVRSGVSFFDCDVDAAESVPGIDAFDSCITVQGGRVAGGRGDDAGSFQGEIRDAGSGHPGIRLWGAAGRSDATIIGVALDGGPGGEALDAGTHAANGAPLDVLAGTYHISRGANRSIEAPTAVSDERSVVMSLDGEPGQRAWIVVPQGAVRTIGDEVVGDAGLPAALADANPILLGTVPSSGRFERSFAVPNGFDVGEITRRFGAAVLEDPSGDIATAPATVAVFPSVPIIDLACIDQTARRVRAKCIRPRAFEAPAPAAR